MAYSQAEPHTLDQVGAGLDGTLYALEPFMGRLVVGGAFLQVCTYTYIHICRYITLHTHTYMYIYIHAYICMYMCVHMYMYVYGGLPPGLRYRGTPLIRNSFPPLGPPQGPKHSPTVGF